MDQRLVEQNTRSVQGFAASCALAELIARSSLDTPLGLTEFVALLSVFGARSLTLTAQQSRQALCLTLNCFIAANRQTAVSQISPLQQGYCPTRDTLWGYHLGLDRCLELGSFAFEGRSAPPMGLGSRILAGDFLGSRSSGDEHRSLSRGMEALVLILTAFQSADEARGESQEPHSGENEYARSLPFFLNPKASRSRRQQTIADREFVSGPRARRLRASLGQGSS